MSPSITLHKTITNNKSGKKSDDGENKYSKSGKSTKTSKAASIMKLHKYQIKTKNTFTTLNTKTKDMENEDSYLTDSDDYY